MDTIWEILKRSLVDKAKNIFPTKKRRKQKDWISDEILARMKERKEVQNDTKVIDLQTKKLGKCVIMQKTCGTINSASK